MTILRWALLCPGRQRTKSSLQYHRNFFLPVLHSYRIHNESRTWLSQLLSNLLQKNAYRAKPSSENCGKVSSTGTRARDESKAYRPLQRPQSFLPLITEYAMTTMKGKVHNYCILCWLVLGLLQIHPPLCTEPVSVSTSAQNAELLFSMLQFTFFSSFYLYFTL